MSTNLATHQEVADHQRPRHKALIIVRYKKKIRLKQREHSTMQAPHRGDLHTSICNLVMMLICTFQCVLFVEIFPVSQLSDIDKKSFPPLVVNLKLDPIRFVLCTQVATNCEKVLRYFLCVSVCEYSYVTVCEEKTYFSQYLASADNTVLHPQINHSLTSWAVSHMLHHSCSVTSRNAIVQTGGCFLWMDTWCPDDCWANYSIMNLSISNWLNGDCGHGYLHKSTAIQTIQLSIIDRSIRVISPH